MGRVQQAVVAGAYVMIIGSGSPDLLRSYAAGPPGSGLRAAQLGQIGLGRIAQGSQGCIAL
jgi:hypothetical protein